jgi:Flp pilus assembly protein TadB
LGGPLADYVFEPLLAPGGALASTVGQVIGTGPGRGVALMLIALGVLLLLIVLTGWRSRRVRRVEEEIPDAVGETPAPAVAGAAAGMPTAAP